MESPALAAAHARTLQAALIQAVAPGPGGELDANGRSLLGALRGDFAAAVEQRAAEAEGAARFAAAAAGARGDRAFRRCCSSRARAIVFIGFHGISDSMICGVHD